MDRSRRAARPSAGYAVAANDTSDRNLRIALRNKHKRVAESSNNNKKESVVLPTKKRSHSKVVTRQALASIGKRARHQKDSTTTSTLNKGSNKSISSKDGSNVVPNSNDDRSNTITNSNVMHTNDTSITMTKSLRRSNRKKGRHTKDTTSTNDNNNNIGTTTTTKDHSNESVTTNKSLRRSNRTRAKQQKDNSSTLNDGNHKITTNTTNSTKDCSNIVPRSTLDNDSNDKSTTIITKDHSNTVPNTKLTDYNDESTESTDSTIEEDSNAVPNTKLADYNDNDKSTENTIEEDSNTVPNTKLTDDNDNDKSTTSTIEDRSNAVPDTKLTDDNDNDKSTTKDCLDTVPNIDIIRTNDNATTNDTTNKSTIATIDNTNLLECMDNVSFDNDFMDFIDQGSVNNDSSYVDEGTENNDGNESNGESNTSSSRTRKSKKIAIEQIKETLLPPMPSLLDDGEQSTESVQTHEKRTSRAETPESISFVNNNDEVSIESLRSTNNSITYSQTSHKSKYMNGKIEKIDDIVTAFNLPKSTKSNLPSQREIKVANLKINSPKRYATLISTLVKCIKVLTDVTCPGPNKNDVLNSLAMTKPFSSLNSHMKENTLVKRNRKTSSITDTQLLHSVVQTAFNIMEMSPKGSVQRRVVRALLVKSIPQTSILRDLSFLCKHPRIDAGTRYVQAKQDYESMEQGSSLTKTEFARKSIKDSVIEDAVDFLLHKDHISTVSWGSIDCVLSKEETVVLPKISRRVSCKVLWDRFRQYHLENNEEYVKQTTFYAIMNTITRSDLKSISSVDYVESLLVTDTIENIQNMIDDMISDTTECEILSDYLTSLSTFLKYGYKRHAIKVNDDCTTHGLSFILGNSTRRCTSNNIKTNITCTECKFPYYAINEIKDSIIRNNTTSNVNNISDCLTVLDDALDRFVIYMGHKARCKNQSEYIKQVEDDMKKVCIDSKGEDTRGLLVMDFKMKFNPISARESTIEHYGKRGISWHGFCLIYYLYDNETKEPIRYSTYLDQILSDGNKQDAHCVVSLLEAALNQIIHDLPFINSVTLQSDNARCYENHFIMVAISILNEIYHSDIFISAFVHTETQDGKTLLDAHFARCIRFLSHFMKTWKRNKITRINTPRGLGFALAWNGGMCNVMVQVVRTDKPRLIAFEKKLENVIKKLKKYFGRVNHIYYIKPDGPNVRSRNDCTLNIIDDMKFEIAVQLFSNIGRKLHFKIDLANNSVTPDNVTLSEIESSLRGDDFLDGSSAAARENVIPSLDNDTSTSATLAEDKNDESVNDFSIVENVESDDDSDFDPNEYESDDDNDPVDGWNVVDIDGRVYCEPNQTYYNKNNFLTNVHIEKMMELGGYVSKGYQFSRGDRRINGKLREIHRKDAVACAVRYAHSKLMSGECVVQDCNYEDTLLQDASQYCIPVMDELKKGWGRRSKFTEGGTYGKKYITKYKDELKELFDKGNVDSSHKMNPAMMREYLVTKYPFTYSLPGETEIKQQISAFAQHEKAPKRKQTTRQVGQRESWEDILEEVVRNDRLGAPEHLYNIFIETYEGRETATACQLPVKAAVKRKISTLKTKFRNIAHHSIL